MQRQIILASISPRRKELMKLLKIKFKAIDSGYNEKINPHLSHRALVKHLALGKARAAATKYPRAIIIAADTMVIFKGKAIGKPKNPRENFKMLKNFRAQPQEVFTGMAIVDAKSKKVFTAVTCDTIYFKNLSGKEIQQYVESGEGLDKAGGYGPLGKGLNLIKKIAGDYTTAIGMNMEFVINSLTKLGIKV